MKKIIILALFLFPLMVCPVFATNTNIDVNAQAAVLINADTGRILYYKNAFQPMSPASTTKIMTAILALENSDLDQVVTVPRVATLRDGTSLKLQQNERISLRNLLYGLLLSSGNDAAAAIAIKIAGSETNFARLMTQKAREIGMSDTHYQNASGLPARGHFTTANDMAILARYALKNGNLSKIVSTKNKKITSYCKGRPKIRDLYNHNKLLWKYPYCIGVKTGYTMAAGGCLVSAARKNGETLIAVVFKTKCIYDDSLKLFDYGFRSSHVASN